MIESQLISPTSDGQRRLEIWIVQNGEEIPTDPGPPRLLRQGILAEQLVARGHHVTYWAPSFNHQRRRQRTPSDLDGADPSFQIRLLASRSFARNVSVKRIQSHRDAARAFSRQAEALTRPNVIVSGYPTIELAHASVDFAFRHGIPSVVDFRDQWPDIVSQQLGRARILGAPLIRHWRRLQSEVVREATSVCGITDEFVDWALERGPRSRGLLDLAFPLAPPIRRPSDRELAESFRHLTLELGPKPPGSVWAVFAGSLGRRSDILTVVEAARRISEVHGFRLIVAGAGDLASDVDAMARVAPNVSFIGWRSAAEVTCLLGMADVGVLPYPNTSDFLMSYPNKVGEYLSHGLPVLSSLDGVTGRLLRSHDLLDHYREGDVDDCERALREGVARGPSPPRVETAKQLFKHRFNPEVIYPAYAQHVEEVAKHRRWRA